MVKVTCNFLNFHGFQSYDLTDLPVSQKIRPDIFYRISSLRNYLFTYIKNISKYRRNARATVFASLVNTEVVKYQIGTNILKPDRMFSTIM